MAKSDLRTRPAFHTLKEFFDAPLTVVMTAVTVGRWSESATGWSPRKLVQALRFYREMRINVCGQAVVAVPSPPELVDVMSGIRHRTAGKPYRSEPSQVALHRH